MAHCFIEERKQKLMPHLKHIKTFVPIFPWAYQNLSMGEALGDQYSMSLYGKKEMPATIDNERETLHKIAQIKFQIEGNRLLNHEETREKQIALQLQEKRKYTDYLLELDFENIKSVWIHRDQRHLQKFNPGLAKRGSAQGSKDDRSGYYEKRTQFEEREREMRKFTGLDIMIQLKKPCQALKFGPNKDFSEVSGEQGKQQEQERDRYGPSFVRSPLNMSTNLHEEIDHDKYLQGQSQTQRDEKKQVNYETLTNYWNQHQVFHLAGTASKASLEVFLKTLKRINPNAKVHESDAGLNDLGINQLDMQYLIRELSQIQRRGLRFSEQLNQMRPSLRFSILALLSSNKFNIFNNGLIEFMEMINNGNWNKHQVISDYGAYLIDQINLFYDLDYKDDSNNKLCEIFTRFSEDPAKKEEFKRVQNNDNLMRQRRVLVTPTLFHYTVAKEEESNKVLRQYKEYHVQFIRLSFVQEDLDKGFYFNENSRFLLGYIHSILKNGFFAGRGLQNTFLSYSNSQLKNHTCWFLAQVEGGINEKVIISKMGSFEHEKNILKRYARRGQCFSTTKNVAILSRDDVSFGLSDIERDGFNFSDGCGLIHPELAQAIATRYKFSSISAFQIRLGGAKGVLAVASDVKMFKKQDGTYFKVLLRPSQVKFPSDHFTLDIIRCATYSQGFLNRQIITLLHCLGVPSEFFLKQQSSAKEFMTIESLYQRLQDKIEKIHLKFGNIMDNQGHDFSKDFTIMKNKRLQDLAKDLKLSMDPCKGGFQAPLKEAILKGVDIRKEPVFSSILHSMELNQMMNLKKKARILLPESCVLIGIVDPTGTLEEGEVFVQLRKDSFSMHKHGQGIKARKNRMERAEVFSSIDSISDIIQGQVLVTRNPCTHPGDIRLLQCVDNPELRYLFNVIVFSSKGQRPSCNMMSGGDLDGDVYFIAWDKEMISYIKPENIKEPADYSKSELIKEKPDSDDLADYFVFYLQRDVLGTVSNLWLQLADYYGQQGPCHEYCISLSHMCSVAVDFAKHGECVSKRNYKFMQDLIDQYPDFLEKDPFQKPSFPSDGVLGQLYRDIDSTQALNDFIQNDWTHSIALQYELDENILNLAAENRTLMHQYLLPVFQHIVKPMSHEMKKCMMYFSLASEGELFACDLKFRLCHISGEKTFYAGDPGSKTEDAIQNLNTMRRSIVDKHQSIFYDLVNHAQKREDQKAWTNMAVALYLATYFDQNESSANYYLKHKQDQGFNDFKDQFEKQLSDDSFIVKMRTNPSQYHQICSFAEQGDHKKMRKLLMAKKLFCIPWLLAGDSILSSYPDKYDSPQYRQMLIFKQQAKQAELLKKQENALQQQQAQQRIQVQPQRPPQPSREQLSKMSQQQKLNKIFGVFQPPSQANKENALPNALAQMVSPQKHSVQVTDSKPLKQNSSPKQIPSNKNLIASGDDQIVTDKDVPKSFLTMLTDTYGQFAEMKLKENEQSQEGGRDKNQTDP